MKKGKSIMDKVVSYLKSEPVPPGPPQETVDATIAKLTEASEQPKTVKVAGRIQIIERIKAASSFTKVAAAAVLLIAASYAAGRLSAPRPPNVQQLQSALEPVIRRNMLEEMNRRWQLAWAGSYVRLKEELNEQRRRDLDTYAVQTLAASNAVTNQLLKELIESLNAAQMEDYRRIAEALYRIELNRLEDKTQLTNGLESLAYQTEDKLERTRRYMSQLLVNTELGSLVPNPSENSNKSKERKE